MAQALRCACAALTRLHVVCGDAGKQPALEKAMDLNFGFPALTAVNNDKKVYAVHTGAFSER